MELTRHSKERYAERIMGKDSAVDINSYIVANEEKIRTDIENMVTYGTLIFKGKPLDYNEKQPVRVYLSGTWIVIWMTGEIESSLYTKSILVSEKSSIRIMFPNYWISFRLQTKNWKLQNRKQLPVRKNTRNSSMITMF